ncbi:MAG: hypothetical protein LAO06_15330 [Acidobacteriia bacterium]|nr:hypothetical protein [Terriglobia bacterium]
MAKITALLHTHNDGARIGRALESLRACDEILVVDHDSSDDTVERAREHGATVTRGVPGLNAGVHAIDARHDWILCLLPTEAVSEAMEASLFEWKDRQMGEEGVHEIAAQISIAFPVRAETAKGWQELGTHTRLVNRKQIRWRGRLPHDDSGAEVLPGHLWRFSKP